MQEYGSQIEIVVCDNSDDEKACLNQSILGPKVHYYKNKVNIGFDGNIIQCAKLANGQFIWIISDDDIILWNGFQSLMDYLPHAGNECIDCIMLPYRNDDFNKNEVLNDQYEWGVEKDTNLLTLLNAVGSSYNHAPFCLFSTAVIRLNKRRLDWVVNEFQGNIMIQIPLFLCMLKPESKLRFLDKAVIEYHETYYVRGFDIRKYYYWHREVTSFLEKEYNVDRAMLDDNSYKEFLLMVLAHRVGLRIYPNVDEACHFLMTKIPHNLRLKTIALAIIVVLPGSLVKHPFIFYLSIRHACGCGNLSLNEVISRYRILNNFIRTKEKERRALT